MKIIFSLLIFIYTTSFAFSQSKPCLLDVQSAPVLGGVKLGMTPEEVGRVYGRSLKLTPRNNAYVFPKDKDFIDYLLKKNDLTESEKRRYILHKKLADENNPVSKKLIASMNTYEPFDSYHLDLYFDDIKHFDSRTKGYKDLAVFNGMLAVELDFFQNRIFKMSYVYKTNWHINLTDQERISRLTKSLNFPGEYWTIRYPGAFESKCKDFEVYSHMSDKTPVMGIFIYSPHIVALIEEKMDKKVEEMYQNLKKEMDKPKP